MSFLLYFFHLLTSTKDGNYTSLFYDNINGNYQNITKVDYWIQTRCLLLLRCLNNDNPIYWINSLLFTDYNMAAVAGRSPLLMRIVSASVSVSKKAGNIIRDVLKKGELGIVEKV